MTKADKDPLRKAFDSACKPRVQAAVKAEREACAKLIEGYDDHTWGMLQQDELAEAIRARGNT